MKGCDMYGKWVIVPIGEAFEVNVFVFCTPDTTDDELLRRAWKMLAFVMKEHERETPCEQT